MAYCQRVERLLRIDLDRHGQSVDAVVGRIGALPDREVPLKTKGNLQTAVRRYDEFRRATPLR